MAFVSQIYKVTAQLPKEEIYGISSQIRRSAISIPSNIAEGQRRKNSKEFVQFLYIADGSAAEVETQLLLIENLYKKELKRELELLNEIHKMLYSLINRLKTEN